MKECGNCGAEKDLSKFYRHPTGSHKRASFCIECSKIKSREDYNVKLTKMMVYYEGELLQIRQFTRFDYRHVLLEKFRKLYGRKFDECEIKYEKIYHENTRTNL